MEIAIGVVTHKARYKMGAKLADKVNAEVLSIDEPDDNRWHLGPERNHLRTWSWLKDSKTDWSVVLEDDAIPISNFQDELQLALSKAPSPVVGLYLGRGRPEHWVDAIQSVMASEAHWLMGRELLNCVGVAIQTPLVPFLCQYLTNRLPTEPDPFLKDWPIDELISMWVMNKLKVKVAYSHPSLVDHNTSTASLIVEHKTKHEPVIVDGINITRTEPARIAWMCGTRTKGWGSTTKDIPTPIQRSDGLWQLEELPGI